MREIKFRAWDKISEEIYTVKAINFEDGRIIYFDERLDDDVTREGKDMELMTFTGLKDKNGKEIYEGDILKGKQYGHIVEVEHEKDCCAFMPFLDMYDSDYTGENWYECEVVSNIFENPELLEKKK